MCEIGGNRAPVHAFPPRPPQMVGRQRGARQAAASPRYSAGGSAVQWLNRPCPLWHIRRAASRCCRSSVVEHPLGKGGPRIQSCAAAPSAQSCRPSGLWHSGRTTWRSTGRSLIRLGSIVAVCKGSVTRADIEGYLDGVVVADTLSYRKIFDITQGTLALSDDDMMASRRAHQGIHGRVKDGSARHRGQVAGRPGAGTDVRRPGPGKTALKIFRELARCAPVARRPSMASKP